MQGIPTNSDCPDCAVLCSHFFGPYWDGSMLLTQLHHAQRGHHILVQRLTGKQPPQKLLFVLADGRTTEYATVLYSSFLGCDDVRKKFTPQHTSSPPSSVPQTNLINPSLVLQTNLINPSLVPQTAPNLESTQQCPATLLTDSGLAAPAEHDRPLEAGNENQDDNQVRAEHAPSEARKRTDISMAELSQYFHLTIAEAGKALNLSGTSLKKICRKHGLERWPHRKVKSVNNKVSKNGSQNPVCEAMAQAI